MQQTVTHQPPTHEPNQTESRLTDEILDPFSQCNAAGSVLAQAPSGSGSGVPSVAIPKTTAVLVIQTAKQGVAAQQIMDIIPSEIRATVKLYLDGKIREWYSRGDGRGIVVLIEAKSEDEARAIAETLALEKAQLMDTVYVPVGPLMPLRALIGPGAQTN
ncbi:MAG: hypothetical protein ACRDHW_12105 [Ktedonobacteraceae bacterium]